MKITLFCIYIHNTYKHTHPEALCAAELCHTYRIKYGNHTVLHTHAYKSTFHTAHSCHTNRITYGNHTVLIHMHTNTHQEALCVADACRPALCVLACGSTTVFSCLSCLCVCIKIGIDMYTHADIEPCMHEYRY